MSHKKFPIIYYAHSMLIYNTQQEQTEFNFLKKVIKGNIVCPNKHIGNLPVFEGYLMFVRKANALVCSEIEGMVGKGVFLEIKEAKANNIPVYVLRLQKKRFRFYEVKSVKVENEDNWRSFGKISVGRVQNNKLKYKTNPLKQSSPK